VHRGVSTVEGVVGIVHDGASLLKQLALEELLYAAQ
jgi:hypothetical protein